LSLKVTFLGTGTSHGVPMIGCACAVCRSTDPKDRRSRPSVLIEIVDDETGSDGGDGLPPFARGVRHVLVDTSTDLRTQALANGVTRVDAILFTHSHADHVLGLDEIRRFNVLQRESIPCFGDERTLVDLRRTFAYIFSPGHELGGGIPRVALFRIGGAFTLGGREFIPVPIYHGRRPIFGFRVGTFAYLTDCSRIPDTSWPLLAGVRTLVVDALRDRPHPTHFTIAEALDVVDRLAPDRAYFTHICHDLPHAATCARLPAGVELAYDGLVLSGMA
jgi:phosphoribosyl 1,2-cyclic phosphate phosphodiesterase